MGLLDGEYDVSTMKMTFVIKFEIESGMGNESREIFLPLLDGSFLDGSFLDGSLSRLVCLAVRTPVAQPTEVAAKAAKAEATQAWNDLLKSHVPTAPATQGPYFWISDNPGSVIPPTGAMSQCRSQIFPGDNVIYAIQTKRARQVEYKVACQGQRRPSTRCQ
jgi:hypothetical protein